MAKKVGTILMGLFVLAFSSVNLYFYFNRDNPNSPISGMAITELPLGLNMSVIAFILQWVVLLLVVMFAYMKFLKHRKEEDEKIGSFVIPTPKSRSETNMDVFYKFLKEKKSLSTRTISKLFTITKEKALDWARILEEHELVIIEYPAFSDPEVKIKEKEPLLSKKTLKPEEKPKKLEDKKQIKPAEEKNIEQNKEKEDQSRKTKEIKPQTRPPETQGASKIQESK